MEEEDQPLQNDFNELEELLTKQDDYSREEIDSKEHIIKVEDMLRDVCSNIDDSKTIQGLDSSVNPASVPQASQICYVCDTLCCDEAELQEHERQHEEAGLEAFQCSMCPFSAKRAAALKKHKALHYHRKPYSCTSCPYSTNIPASLKKHIMTHTGEKPYACNRCSYSCTELGNLRKHQLVHSELKPFVCELCHFSCRLASEITRHKLFCNNLFIRTNGNVFDPETFIDDKIAESKVAHLAKSPVNNKKKHLKKKSGKKEKTQLDQSVTFDIAKQIIKTEPPDETEEQSYLFPEEGHPSSGVQVKSEAGEEVLQKDEIRNLLIKMEDDPEDNIKYTETEIHHMMAFFPMKKELLTDMQYPLVCYICDFSCKESEEFKRHKLVHRGQKLFPCTLCNSTCKKASDFKRHKMLHFNLKPYICDVCPYSTAVSTNLRKHKMIHTGEKPYACDACTYACSELGSLKKHKLIHSGEKPFVCDLCDFSCRSSSDLRRHKAIHCDVKQFSCDQCSYTCSRLDTLRSHRFLHTGQRPYGCQFCPFTCKTLGILVNHRRTHSGEKPYGCQACPFTCAQLASFRRHMRSHSEVRKYTCSKCTFASKRQMNLKKHLLLHKSAEAENKKNSKKKQKTTELPIAS